MSEAAAARPQRSQAESRRFGATLRRYWPLLRHAGRQWRRLLTIALLTFVAAAFGAFQPWPLKLIADNAVGRRPAPHIVRSVLAFFSLTPTPRTLVAAAAVATLLLFVATSATAAAITWNYTVATQRMMYDMAAELFGKLQRRSLSLHGRSSVGDSLSRLSVDTRTICSNLPVFLGPAQQVVRLGLLGAVAWRLDPVLTIVLFAIAPPTAISARVFGGRLKARAGQGRKAQARLMSLVHQALDAMPAIQAFSAEERSSKHVREAADLAVQTVRRSARVRSTFTFVSRSSIVLGTAVVLYVGAQRVHSGATTIGALFIFLTYSRVVQLGVGSLANTYSTFKEAAASGERVLAVLEEDEGVRDAPGARRLSARVAGEVRLEGVTFGYEPGRPVLHGLSLEARPGEIVALVGATGAGKSTLMSLIPRFFDPWSGRVTVDGFDLRQVTLASLRRQVSVVLQEPFLLPLSVAENIAYGRPDAQRSEIVRAAMAANAHEFIAALPEGYETVIDERGAGLSGGERQRLSVARALLKDAPILILDEPTSAVDAETEARLMDAIQRLVEGRTTFVIAHRLSTVRRADRIVVIDHGRIVETGTHEQLLAAHGTYDHMHRLQLGLREVTA